jgi:hypothetical protein
MSLKIRRAILVAVTAVGLAAGTMGAVAAGTVYHHGAKTHAVAGSDVYHHG